MAVQHWMTFGTFAEQRYFIYPDKNTYDGIIFNANMVMHAPSGLAAFLMEKTREKMPYIIDPLTHAFQHDPSVITAKKKDGTSEIKAPIKNLANVYGGPIETFVGTKPVQPKDFGDKRVLKDFVYNVLKFQKEYLSNLMADSDVNKKYLEHTEEDLKPYCLVAPYFYMTESTYNLWLPIIVDALKISKEFDEFSSCKIFSSIVVSQGVILDNDIVDRINEQLQATSADGFLLWVDGLEEYNAGRVELRGLLKLSTGLRNNFSREVINLHGGYFSILAGGGQFNHSYLTGVAHGPEFGETRAVVPVGGGIPIAKFYIPKLHNRVKYNDALTFFSYKNWLVDAPTFYKNVCNCPECRAVIGGDITNFRLYGITDSKPVKRGSGFVTIDYPTKETKEHCLKHYLQIKKVEYQFASTKTRKELLDNLQQGIDEYVDITGMDYLSYLQNWITVLSSY